MRDHNASNTRVLYVQPSDHFGGAERQAATVLPRLVRQGLDVTALVGPGRTIVDWLSAAGVRDIVHSSSFPHDWAESRGLERLGRVRQFAARAGRLEQEIEEILQARRIDVVVAAMAFSWAAATAACHRQGVPIIWRAGGMELSWPQRMLLPLWARRHPPDALICNSEAVRQMFAPLVPAPSSVVRNGVDGELFRVGAGRAERLRPPGAGAVVGFAGRLVPQKRPQDFLAMAAVVAARHPEVSFLMAGAGSRRAQVEQQARELGLAGRVHFPGLVPDMRDFHAACDLLVLPSRSEGCPNIVLEAMAMKVAVVASDTPATAEIIQPMRDGLLYPVGQVDALVDAVELLLSAPHLRAALAERAWQKVHGPLSAAASARALALRIRAALRPAPGQAPVGVPAFRTRFPVS